LTRYWFNSDLIIAFRSTWQFGMPKLARYWLTITMFTG